MRFLIFSRNPNARSYKRIIAEAESRNHEIVFARIPNLNITSEFSKPFDVYKQFDLVHVLSGNRFLNQGINAIFNRWSVSVVNGNLGEFDTQSKLSQMNFYYKAGIPVPKTIYSMNPVWKEMTDILGQDFVGKPIYGSKGEGVILLKDPVDLNGIVNATQYIFQEHIKNDCDYRVHVFGDVACCLYRRKRKSGFVNNASQGAITEPLMDSEEMKSLKELAVLTANAGGFDYVGVDIVRSLDNGKLYVLETNSAPGMYDVEQDSNEDYAVRIIDFYEHSVIKNKSK
jgi:ribosomal protein S6--L-glutamate ligase